MTIDTVKWSVCNNFLASSVLLQRFFSFLLDILLWKIYITRNATGQQSQQRRPSAKT